MRYLVILAFSLLALTGCKNGTTTSPLPVPTNVQVGGFEGAATYGIAVHVMNQYLYSPDCTNPITTIPCSKAAIRQNLRDADNKAYPAMLAAVAAIRAAPNAANTASLITRATGLINTLDLMTKSTEVQSTLTKGN